MIPTLSFWKRQGYGDVKRLPGLRAWGGVGRKGWKGRAQRIFRAVELFCVIPQEWIHVILYLLKPIKCRAPRVIPNVNHKLWVIMTCQFRFVDFNKCTTAMWDIDTVHVWTQGYENYLYFLLNFWLELKISLKNKFISLKKLSSNNTPLSLFIIIHHFTQTALLLNIYHLKPIKSNTLSDMHPSTLTTLKWSL